MNAILVERLGSANTKFLAQVSIIIIAFGSLVLTEKRVTKKRITNHKSRPAAVSNNLNVNTPYRSTPIQKDQSKGLDFVSDEAKKEQEKEEQQKQNPSFTAFDRTPSQQTKISASQQQRQTLPLQESSNESNIQLQNENLGLIQLLFPESNLDENVKKRKHPSFSRNYIVDFFFFTKNRGI